jgi:hypothetical protein
LFHDNFLNVGKITMEQDNSTGFWPRLRTHGLRGVSAFMAVFCGVATAAVLAFTLVLFAGVGAAMVSASKTGETAWRSGAVNLQAKSQRQAPCPAAPQAACPPPIAANLPAPEIATMSLALFVAALPSLALAYGLFEACRCFGAMAQGRFLARATVSRLTRFAIGGLFFVVLFPHAGAMATAVNDGLGTALDLLTHAPQPITRSSDFSFRVAGMSEWLNAIYALTLTVVALIMARASRIAEDHAQIV